MGKFFSQIINPAKLRAKLGLIEFTTVAIIYAGFAIYLYMPHFKHLNRLEYLLVVNPCLASLGCFMLSRRWVSSLAGSFFAGAMYGFGPFMLGLSGYHPSAVFLTASIPWLFFPAVFGPKQQWLKILLSALPFLAVILFFQLSAHYRLFVIPAQAKLNLVDLAIFTAPLVMVNRSTFLVGFYHIPIAPLVFGFCMLLVARRFGVIAIFATGLILAFCDSALNISPIIWLSMPVLCCSILIGMGMHGLISASYADRRWLLATALIMMVLSITALLLATKYFQIFAGLGAKYAILLTETAKMYILGTIAVAIMFFMARAKLRIQWLRWVILCFASAVDIFLGARFIVDRAL